MWTDFLILMKQEIVLLAILFILLIVKLGKDRSNESYMMITNVLLLLNLLAGFIGSREGMLFNEMFRTNQLMVLEKNILNLGMLIISMQSYSWLKNHKHVLEFFL